MIKKTALILPVMLVLFSGCLNQQKATNIIFSDYQSIDITGKSKGPKVALDFTPGNNYRNPTFVVWLECPEGKLLQTLYVTKSYGTGIFARADAGNGNLHDYPGESIRPAALPYWSHKRGVLNDLDNYAPTPEQPVTDAYTGATPTSNFMILTNMDTKLRRDYNVFLEVNQPWDSNEFWNEEKFPDDIDYKTSCQPSLIYKVCIDDKGKKEFTFEPIGHGHYSGKSGELFADISTLTTAKEIFQTIYLIVE